MEQHERTQYVLDFREHTDALRHPYAGAIYQHTQACKGIQFELKSFGEPRLADLLVEEDRLLWKNNRSFKLVGVDEAGTTEALVDVRRDIKKEVTR